ncbi:alpha/beta hydrolase family protein [Nitrincola alkalisediminis]|uniref:alpha/beta hydrolase family protein n=1 Tax=Nitrincola alkalisediminis TaxID=1366656 RepID=UPI0018760DF6|nr:alpha/beta fold hydrolase [Nitrincola alkalisediminis]
MKTLNPIRILLHSLLILTCWLGISNLYAQDLKSPHPSTGRMMLNLDDSISGRTLEGYIWYPTHDSADAVWEHGNWERVWEPIEVIIDAEPAVGTFPVLLLSHGLFGTAHNQAWLAKALVAQGYIVVAINHPGTSHFFRDADQRRELWQRARDISRVIDYLTSDFVLSTSIRSDEIYMAGHSLGGHTAMLLAGARYSARHFDDFCVHHIGELVCGLFNEWQVAKTETDRQQMELDWSDTRIKAFAIFDLGGSQSFDPESVKMINVPMLVFGAPRDTLGLDLNIESRYLIEHLKPDVVTYHEPEQLGHFDFLGVCTEHGLAVLSAEEPDDRFVCFEGREERREMHQRIVQVMMPFFDQIVLK